MTDFVEYQDYIGRKTNYGKKPGPEPWHSCRQLLSTYTDPLPSEAIIGIFQEAGCRDEIAAAKWIVINEANLN